MWMESHNGTLAKFIAQEGGKVKNFTLASHDGWKQLIQLRNDRHLATYQRGSQAASTTAMAKIFRKRSAAAVPEPAAKVAKKGKGLARWREEAKQQR